MAKPTAVPMIPDSASGVSMTRWSPKSFCSPSVTRKTPPSLPTSSPMMITLSSSSSADRKPAFRAPDIVILVMMRKSLHPRKWPGIPSSRAVRRRQADVVPRTRD
ncbi:Uncharacterised protein [Mycobacteroides abscessus subsp. abscessus]|nr:Uncharacterised protein [Mycobacteroides abscessus subsp. abscessus]